MPTVERSEATGTFSEWRLHTAYLPAGEPGHCPHCGQAGVFYSREFRSHDGCGDDFQFECRACGRSYWFYPDDDEDD